MVFTTEEEEIVRLMIATTKAQAELGLTRDADGQKNVALTTAAQNAQKALKDKFKTP